MMAQWEKYTGSDEQILELQNAEHGFIIKNIHGYIWEEIYFFWHQCPIGSSHYLICKPHPLADMICQQARTGQPVWMLITEHQYWTMPLGEFKGKTHINGKVMIKATKPNWDIDKAEYSFTEFKEEV